MLICHYYNEHLKYPITQKQILFNKDLTKNIYDIYYNVLRNYPDKPMLSFTYTTPETDRDYNLYRNKREDKRFDSTYGITVIASTTEDANGYTLVSLLNEDPHNSCRF
jgi:hypothetical protein